MYDYFVDLDAPVTVDEQRVQATLSNGETYGDIDHLIVTDDAYHIVDYKTNKLTDEATLDEKANHYYWQMRAYAVALHQTDPERQVTATLLFTEAGESREFDWAPEELDAEAKELDDEICGELWPDEA